MDIITRLSRFKYGAYVLLVIIHIPILQGEEQSQCPSLSENPICPCYNFKEGKLISIDDSGYQTIFILTVLNLRGNLLP